MKSTKHKRKAINITVPEHLVDYIEAYAEEHMMNRSSAVTQMVLQHKKQSEGENK